MPSIRLSQAAALGGVYYKASFMAAESAWQGASRPLQLPRVRRRIASREKLRIYQALLLVNGEKVRTCLPSRYV
jgi:hypothetical protein